VRAHDEAARDVLDGDRAGGPAGAGSAASRRTIPARTLIMAESWFGISIRRSRWPSSPARCTASVSMSQRISR
jgi:hypothetical protein